LKEKKLWQTAPWEEHNFATQDQRKKKKLIQELEKKKKPPQVDGVSRAALQQRGVPVSERPSRRGEGEFPHLLKKNLSGGRRENEGRKERKIKMRKKEKKKKLL